MDCVKCGSTDDVYEDQCKLCFEKSCLCYLCDLPIVKKQKDEYKVVQYQIWKYNGNKGFKFDKDEKITEKKCRKKHSLKKIYNRHGLKQKHIDNHCNCHMNLYYICKKCNNELF